PAGSSTSWMNWGRSGGSVLLTVRSPITPERARRGSLLNGIERVVRSGTTSWPSPAHTNFSPVWDILTCGESRRDLVRSRRQRWSEPCSTRRNEEEPVAPTPEDIENLVSINT